MSVGMDSCPIPQHCRLLVASPNFGFRELVRNHMPATGWEMEEVAGGAEALDKVETGAWDALVLDQCLADLEVQELERAIRTLDPRLEIFLVDSTARKLLSPQAPPNPHHLQELFQSLKGIYEASRPRRHGPVRVSSSEAGRTTYPENVSLPGMIGGSRAMQQVYRLARLVSPRRTTVLVIGETGTGKELVARAIHALSPRARHPFTPVNCAAIPEALAEAELFGYARGAFTGAYHSQAGRIAGAHLGTLFLDEIGELPLSLQAKLLRFLQEGELQRLGHSEPLRVDVRVIAATNANLEQRVAEGRFREDLYYRLSAFPIEVAPLRHRPQDIVPLAAYLLQALCTRSAMPLKPLSEEACRFLEQQSWRGNVRELQMVLERALVLAEGDSELFADQLSELARRSA